MRTTLAAAAALVALAASVQADERRDGLGLSLQAMTADRHQWLTMSAERGTPAVRGHEQALNTGELRRAVAQYLKQPLPNHGQLARVPFRDAAFASRPLAHK